MGTPMREGSLDGGHRVKVADSRTAANFEYDDNEWDIGIGDLIIDLDADIEKTKEKAGEAGGTGPMAQPTGRAKLAVEHSATVQDKGLKMKIKRTKPGTKTSEAKHEIVKPGEQNGDDKKSLLKRTSGGHRKEKTVEKDKVREKPEMNGVNPSPVVPRPVYPVSHGPGPPVPGPSSAVSNGPSTVPPPLPANPSIPAPLVTAAPPSVEPSAPATVSACSSSDDRLCASPPSKKPRSSSSESKDSVDVCVGTSVGTITEPDCLGPCEPGTSVTLEGIVWHETAAGVLVVNVTWRGKTYVGTLLDCTRHDWAPPRFCDSPTSDLDSRAPKGRGKRGRAGNQSTDLTNFTETRSSVHSKLRNGNGKGRSGRSTTPNVAGPSSPTPRAETKKTKEVRDTTPTSTSAPSPSAPIPVKRAKSTPTSPPPSPVLFECPEQNCCKKYKNVNGLKYHQSHAHSAAEDEDTKDGTSLSEAEESNVEAPSPGTTPDKSPVEKTEPPGKESLPPAPQDPLALPEPSPEPVALPPSSPPLTDSTKSVVKPGVLRFGPVPEDFSFASKAVIAPVAPQPLTQASAPPQLPIKLPQFKVKPAAALMPEDKLQDRKQTGPRKKKKSLEDSPSNRDLPFGSDSGERDDPQSPAYSDISDDAAPVLESEVADKSKSGSDKKGDSGDGGNPHMSPYVGLYNAPFYGQPPYLVPSVPTECKSVKEPSDKPELKAVEKEVKKEIIRNEFPQKIIQHPSHFYSYGFVPNYTGGYVDSSYPVMVDEKSKEGGKGHEDKSPGPPDSMKHRSSPIQVPHPTKVKSEPGKHSNENHQIIKESIEMKSQMQQFMYSRQSGPPPTQEDLRRYLCQRGKEQETKPQMKPVAPNPSPKPKEKGTMDEKKEKEVKQEGQKPTMETQGPPPPPTGQQFAFIHPSYMQSPHYAALPFDPSHPMYRNMNPMLVPGPYGGSPYLGMPRFHAPEDLSRSQPPTKALDLLQHHASQYYTSHKIHELQERALKSPNSGKPPRERERESPSGPPRPPSGPPPAPPTSSASPSAQDPKTGKIASSENQDSRSPPTQRHVHTHHHTHVGLTYPIMPGQYTAPYGAAVLASQQAAAVASVINPYQPK